MALEGARPGCAGAIEEARASTDDGPAARFAEVVETGPKELTSTGGMIATGEPDFAIVTVFGADDFSGWFGVVRREKFVFTIVLADDIEQIGEAVIVIVAGIGTEESLSDRAGRIVLVEDFDQAGKNLLGVLGFRRIADFVAGTVKNDAGMVAVASDDIRNIELRPFVEVKVIVGAVFANGPAVEQFVYDKKTHAVAEVEEFWRGRIVSGADGIAANLFEQGETALPRAEWNGSAERASVVVEADAF